MKSLADRIAHLLRQVSLHGHQERFNAVHRFLLAGHQQLHPFRFGGKHFDGGLLRAGDRLAHQLHHAFQGEWLADVLVSALANGVQQGFGCVVCCHHDDARRRGQLLQLGQQFEPVHARHPHVEQDQIEFFGFELLQAVQPVACRLYGIAALAQCQLQQIAQRLFVVNHQHALARRRSGLHGVFSPGLRPQAAAWLLSAATAASTVS